MSAALLGSIGIGVNSVLAEEWSGLGEASTGPLDAGERTISVRVSVLTREEIERKTVSTGRK